MKCSKIILSLVFGLWCLQAYAQPSALRKADKFYKAKRYAKAIPLYESLPSEELKPPVMSKLAASYRLTNQMEKALSLYEIIVQEDRVRAIQLFYYAEVLMNTGHYQKARQWFLEYLKLEPDNEIAKNKAQACAYVQSIQPLFQDVEVELFSQNSEEDDTAPVFFQDGIVFTSDRNPGVKLLKRKSGWTGRNYVNLYYSQQTGDTSFAEPVIFSRKLNVLNKNTSTSSFTADGKELFFARNSMEGNNKKEYPMQLYSAISPDGKKWSEVEPVNFCSPNYNYMHPAVSPDGKLLFFVSNKAKGLGGMDLYVSRRVGKGWKKPENLGPNVNTPEHEGFPFLFEDGKLYFCSKGHMGFGGFDIFYTEQDSAGNWQKPVNVGEPINSPADDISIFLSAEHKRGMFTSGRAGGDDDIYFFDLVNLPDLQYASTLSPTDASLPEPFEIVTNKKNEIQKEEPEDSPTDATPPIEKPIQNEVSDTTAHISNPNPNLNLNHNHNPNQNPTPTPKPTPHQQITPSANQQISKSPHQNWMVREALVKKAKTPEANKPNKISIISDESLLVNERKTVSESWPLSNELSADLDGSNPRQSRQKILNSSRTFNTEFFEEVRTKYTGEPNDVGKIFKILDSQFGKDQFDIQKSIAAKLDKVVEILNDFPSLDIEIRGHTESVGDGEQNKVLSQHRAEAALKYLVKKGISKERLNAIGYGENYLLNNCEDGINCSEEQHLENQRLEIRVLKF